MQSLVTKIIRIYHSFVIERDQSTAQKVTQLYIDGEILKKEKDKHNNNINPLLLTLVIYKLCDKIAMTYKKLAKMQCNKTL